MEAYIVISVLKQMENLYVKESKSCYESNQCNTLKCMWSFWFEIDDPTSHEKTALCIVLLLALLLYC